MPHSQVKPGIKLVMVYIQFWDDIGTRRLRSFRCWTHDVGKAVDRLVSGKTVITVEVF